MQSFFKTINQQEDKSPISPSKEVIVVGIDIQSNMSRSLANPFYKKYVLTDAQHQIENFVKHIQAICKKLQKFHPNSQWIIATRENAITGFSYAISSQSKKRLNDSLAKLINTYKNLSIFVTLNTYKTVTLDKAKEVADYFETNSSIIEKEAKKVAKWNNLDEKSLAVQNICKFPLEKKYTDNIISKKLENITILKNVTYVHTNQNNKAIKLRTVKCIPFKEVELNIPSVFDSSTITKISSKPHNKGHFYHLANIDIGMEICYEHFLSTLQDEATSEKRTPPLIHFVFSDHIPVIPENVYSSAYIIHIDSQEGVSLYQTSESKQDTSVTVYQHDIYEKYELDNLTRVDACYPFYFRTINAIDALKQKFPDSKETLLEGEIAFLNELEKFRTKFIKITKGIHDIGNPSYPSLFPDFIDALKKNPSINIQSKWLGDNILTVAKKWAKDLVLQFGNNKPPSPIVRKKSM